LLGTGGRRLFRGFQPRKRPHLSDTLGLQNQQNFGEVDAPSGGTGLFHILVGAGGVVEMLGGKGVVEGDLVTLAVSEGWSTAQKKGA
jgi:hypothetical protein